MLAEIFMVRLEAAARALLQPLPSSTSPFVPFNPEPKFTFKETSHGDAEAGRGEPSPQSVRARAGVTDRLTTVGSGVRPNGFGLLRRASND